jgi:hypothetical protein
LLRIFVWASLGGGRQRNVGLVRGGQPRMNDQQHANRKQYPLESTSQWKHVSTFLLIILMRRTPRPNSIAFFLAYCPDGNYAE